MPARRPKEQVIAELDGKISYHQACIEKLNQRKEELLNPKPKINMRQVSDAMKETGLTPDDLLKLISKAKAK